MITRLTATSVAARELTCLCFATFAVTFGCTGWLEPGPEPRLIVPTEPVYLGKGMPGDNVCGTFLLRNAGNKPLRVRSISASCGCTRITPTAPFEIPAGGEQQVEASMELGEEVEQRLAQVTVESDDRKRPSVSFLLKGLVDRFVLVTPPSLDFGDVEPSTTQTKSLQLLTPRGEPWMDEPPVEVTSLAPEVTVSRDRSKGNGFYQVRFLAGAQVSSLESRLQVRHLNTNRTIDVPVQSYVRPFLIAVPRIVEVRRNTEIQDVSVVIKSRDGSSLGPVVRLEGPASVSPRSAPIGIGGESIVTLNLVV